MAKRSRKKKAVVSEVSGIIPAPEAAAQPVTPWYHQDWFWGLILIFAIILAYSPVWWAGYVWDDDYHLTANPTIIGPLGLKEIWTTSAGKFCPFVFMTFWLEHALWGLAPLPYHLVNVLLHGACAIFLWRILRALQIPGAWLGAALWALHPVQVESVAWISEMKNTESGFFFLLTILFFVRWLKTRENDGRNESGGTYALTLLFAFLAMASKSSTVILPLVLALCAWWIEGRWRWRNLAIAGPIFLMSIVASVLTIWNPQPAEGIGAQWVQTWPQRLLSAGDDIWFYLGKLLWPDPLIVTYPRWEIASEQWTSYLPLLAVMLALFIFWFKRETWSRPYFLALGYFLLALLPVLGLVDMTFLHYSFVADHFQYLASMGPLALAGTGLVRLADSVFSGKSPLPSILGAGLLLLLAILSWQRAWAYESRETLWTVTVQQDPKAWFAYNDLGHIRFNQGRFPESVEAYANALRIYPHDPDAYGATGNAKQAMGDLDGALEDFRQFINLAPRAPNADYMRLWIWLIRVQQNQKADADQELASALNGAWNAGPEDWPSKNANFLLGRISESDYFIAANSNDPGKDRDQHCEAWYYAGMKRLLMGDKSTAIDYFHKCLATGQTEFVEYLLARAELKALNAT